MIVACCVVLSVSSFIELASGCLFSLREHQHAKVVPAGVRDQGKLLLAIQEVEYRHTSAMSCEPFDMDADACMNLKILLGRLGSADMVWLPRGRRGGGRKTNPTQEEIVISIGLG